MGYAVRGRKVSRAAAGIAGHHPAIPTLSCEAEEGHMTLRYDEHLIRATIKKETLRFDSSMSPDDAEELAENVIWALRAHLYCRETVTVITITNESTSA